MTEQTIEAPPLPVPEPPPRPAAPGPARQLARQAGRFPWLLGAGALLLISLALVLWARTRPGYDPYGWLVWGHLTLHGSLDTNGAPSWKPLPYLFTVPYNLIGHYALWLWMVTAVAISLSGFVFAWRIGFWLTGAPPERRYAAYIAGAFSAVALMAVQQYWHFILSSQSDTMIVSLCLAAVDCHLCKRHRWAFWCLILGALGRPEVWPFAGLYAVWLWFARRELRMMVGLGILVIPLLWFGIPALTAKTWDIAGHNALHSPRELHGGKVGGTWDRFRALSSTIVWAMSILAVVLTAARRRLDTLVLAAAVVLWLVIEIAFALHGFPAVPRYMFEAAGLACAISGVALGRLILELPPLLETARARLTPWLRHRVRPQAVGWMTGIIALVPFAVLAPAARTQERWERHDLTHERARTREINRLSGVVHRLGAARILACGQPNIPIAYQSVFAWYTGVKIGILYVSRKQQRLHPTPLVNIYPTATGWKVFPSHLRTAAQRARCRGLTYVS